MRTILATILISLFLFPWQVEAIGVKVIPSEIEIKMGLQTQEKEEIVVKNSGKNVALFEVYPDNFSDWIEVVPESFILESEEKKEVKLKIRGENRGNFSTHLSAVAGPLSERKFKANSGIKIPLKLRVKNTENSDFLATISNQVRKFSQYGGFVWMAGILVLLLFGILTRRMLRYRRGKKEMHPK